MISVVIGAHGDERWRDLAWSRAYPSACEQADDVTVIYDPDATLAEVRNLGAETAKCPWLCFLDADDELAPGYITAMEAAVRNLPLAYQRYSRSLLTPRVAYVSAAGRPGGPFFHPRVKPEDGNWLVIGTVVPKRLFREVGGFEEWPIYEDWALFARMQKAGAEVVTVPDAVYRAHRPPRGRVQRNHALDRVGKVEAHEAIRRAIWPELYETVHIPPRPGGPCESVGCGGTIITRRIGS